MSGRLAISDSATPASERSAALVTEMLAKRSGRRGFDHIDQCQPVDVSAQ